jgi:uncharacterized LabA/DUF88 family protein
MKTNVYIDAGNLYYGLLRDDQSAKWLDPLALARTLIRKDHVLGSVKFYTARVRTYPYDAKAIERQRIYLRALSEISGLEIVEGYYNRNKVWMPAVSSECRNCNEATNGRVHVVKLEEKRTDVNIATDMLYDVFTGDIDAVALISGDSDFIAPLELIRRKFGKQVLVFDPHERFSDICYHASYYAHIPRDLPAKCQLPEVIPVGSNGRTIHRPEAWA